MNKYKNIFFKINNQQYIKIKISCSDQIFFHRFDPVEIIFYDKKIKYILSQKDFLGPKIEPLCWFFTSAKDGKLELSESINDDLGYLYNQKIYNESISSKENPDRRIHYFLMFNGNQYKTWFYTKKGSIFLQITPTYKWHFSDPKENEIFTPYEEFIKNYKSCLTIEIKKEVLSEWIKQSNEIMDMVLKNDN